jgi:hypothetical protein
MANDSNRPRVGALIVDATVLGGKLVDLPKGARARLRKERAGVEKAMKEIRDNQPIYGELAGVTARNFEDLRATDELIAEIDARLPAARKLVEILEESRAVAADKRHRLITAVASAVEMHAKAHGDDELLARYEQTRAYRSALGKKAWRTRRRNQELARAAAETPGANDAPGASDASNDSDPT